MGMGHVLRRSIRSSHLRLHFLHSRSRPGSRRNSDILTSFESDLGSLLMPHDLHGRFPTIFQAPDRLSRLETDQLFRRFEESSRMPHRRTSEAWVIPHSERPAQGCVILPESHACPEARESPFPLAEETRAISLSRILADLEPITKGGTGGDGSG